MNCLQCARLELREFPHHAKEGMGRCEVEVRIGAFVSYRKDRDCKTFAAAPADVQQKRIEWSAKLGGKSK